MSLKILFVFFVVGCFCISLSSQRDHQTSFLKICQKNSDCSLTEVCNGIVCLDCYKDPGYDLDGCKLRRNIGAVLTITVIVAVFGIAACILCCCCCCPGCPLNRNRNQNRMVYQQQGQPNNNASQQMAFGQNPNTTNNPSAPNMAPPPPYYFPGPSPTQNVNDAPKQTTPPQDNNVPVAV